MGSWCQAGAAPAKCDLLAGVMIRLPPAGHFLTLQVLSGLNCLHHDENSLLARRSPLLTYDISGE